jgi:hypothetical protein
LRKFGGEPEDLRSADFVAFVLSERTESRQKKAISALGAFGKYLADVKSRTDPARDLTERVRIAADERAIADALRRVGMSDVEISGLRWRDILAGIFVGAEPTIGRTSLPKDAPTARQLGELLLERLRNANVDTASELLGAPVFGGD